MTFLLVLLSVLFNYRLARPICCNLLFMDSSFDFCLKQILSSCHCSLQCPASPSLLPSLYGHLQRPAGLRGWPCSDGILRSGSCPGSAACGLCPLCCLSEPPGPPWVCLQAAWASGSPSAYYHPADVPGVLGHGQSSFAFCLSLYMLWYWTNWFHVIYFDLLYSHLLKYEQSFEQNISMIISRTITAMVALQLWLPLKINSSTRLA